MDGFLELDEILFRRAAVFFRSKGCVITDAQGRELMYAESGALPLKFQLFFLLLFAAGLAIFRASELLGLLYLVVVTVVIAYTAKKSELLVYSGRQKKDLLFKVTPSDSNFSFRETMTVLDKDGLNIGDFQCESTLFKPLGGWKLRTASLDAEFNVALNLWKARRRFVFVDARTKGRIGSAGVSWNTRKANLDLTADVGKSLDRRLAVGIILYAFNLC